MMSPTRFTHVAAVAPLSPNAFFTIAGALTL